MAKVFLSYVRKDEKKARALAGALERAGHEVWWDRQIKGGAQYSREIDAALKAADVVAVLWSEASVDSAWVRDEAAAGRDRGCLVPVTLDGVEAPLGFRQYQTVDLSRWHGRGDSRQLEQLLKSIGAPADQDDSSRVRQRNPGTKARLFHLRRWVAAGAVMVAGTVGATWWWSSGSEPHIPSVAIEAVSKTPQSREVARELTVALGELQSAQSSSFQLISGTGRADLRLEVGSADSAAGLRRDLSLLSGSNGSILWSTSLRSPADADALSRQLTLTSERVLSCALDALSDGRDRIEPDTLKVYLGGCSLLQDVYGNDEYHPELERLFEQVVSRAPHFQGAWAKLLQSEAEPAAQPDPPQLLVANLHKHISAVEALGLDMGELYAAKAALLPADDFLGKFALYDQGIKNDPTNPLLYQLRSYESQRVGRMTDMVSEAAKAMQLDPLSPALAENYASALAYSGQVQAAYVQLQKAEAKWPGAPNLTFARFRLDLRFGDPKEALAMYRSAGGTTGIEPGMESFIEARIDTNPANVQKAVDAERAQYAQEPRYIAGLLQVLGQFGRKDEAIEVMLHYARPDATGYNADTFFRPAMRDVWRDPRSIAAAAHMGLLAYWMKSGKWPDFCFDPTLPYDCRNEAGKYQ
jgi:tetratricopeptide (TPR) repeat protein